MAQEAAPLHGRLGKEMQAKYGATYVGRGGQRCRLRRTRTTALGRGGGLIMWGLDGYWASGGL
ncbi:hypothetical protein E2562_024174 [Oryza meyeriana var. granulata]|uniref:Uncharacterized protein n=1 Tax=Oryza meyeriana var. granulata TaxID=110450 RepID=A0A6G1CI39_9ORYZ|nr:hypothetical protein E2562_024174 [Oryza meyeriana var. granulata]